MDLRQLQMNVEIAGCGYRPCRRLNWHKNRTQNPLLLPFAASFFATSDRSERYGGSVWESNPCTKIARHRNEIPGLKVAWYTPRYTVILSETYFQ